MAGLRTKEHQKGTSAMLQASRGAVQNPVVKTHSRINLKGTNFSLFLAQNLKFHIMGSQTTYLPSHLCCHHAVGVAISTRGRCQKLHQVLSHALLCHPLAALHPLVLPFPPVLQLSLGMAPSGIPLCQWGASLCSAWQKSLTRGCSACHVGWLPMLSMGISAEHRVLRITPSNVRAAVGA